MKKERKGGTIGEGKGGVEKRRERGGRGRDCSKTYSKVGFVVRDSGIRQWSINECKFQIMINKITLSIN